MRLKNLSNYQINNVNSDCIVLYLDDNFITRYDRQPDGSYYMQSLNYQIKVFRFEFMSEIEVKAEIIKNRYFIKSIQINNKIYYRR